MNNGKNLNLFIWQFHLIHIEMNSNAKLNRKEIVILNKCLHKWMCITEWRSHRIKWNGNFWRIRLKTAFCWKNAICVCTRSILSQSQPIHPIRSNLYFGFGWLLWSILNYYINSGTEFKISYQCGAMYLQKMSIHFSLWWVHDCMNNEYEFIQIFTWNSSVRRF